MSHMTLEYSANLRNVGRFPDLCRKLAQFMAAVQVDAKAVFAPGGVRVRAICCDEFCIADGTLQDAGFVHAILKIGVGRTGAAKHAVCEGLFDIIKDHFTDAVAARGLALSMELAEFSEAGTLKHNNLHARFQR